VLELGPDPRDRGLVHGKAMHASIRDNLATYLARFEVGGSTRAEVLAEAERWAAFIKADNPDYAEEMAAVAIGSALSLTEIALLNARYEITYCLFSREADRLNAFEHPPEAEGCTAFGLMPEVTADGRTWIGQNWDWLENIRGRTVIQRVRRSAEPSGGKPDFVGFTEAGIVGCKSGVNAAGIGLCVNGLVTRRDGANGLRKPFHVRCAEVLDAWTFDKAIAPVVQTDRTCSTNYLIGHAEGEIIDIEATPDFCAYIYPSDGIVTHANHLQRETRISSEFERISAHSLFRGVRLERLLRRKAGGVDLSTMATALSDHFSYPGAICRHSDTSLPAPKRVITVAAIAIDLKARVLYTTDGQVCQSAFQAFPLYDQPKASGIRSQEH
jgi:isopenicillin-N N-acyltransferase like protein